METLDDIPAEGDGPADRSHEEAAIHGTKAISRAMLILRLIARHEIFGVRLTQLTDLTGIPHPTIRRVLKCLIDERLVIQDSTTRRYKLGPLNFELGLATLHSPEYSKRFHPLLERIASASADTTYLVVRSGTDSVCLDRIIGTHPIKTVTLEIGGRRPLGFGAASLALLAQYSDEEIREILSINKREIEIHKRLSRDRILRGIAHVREHGYSVTKDIATIGAVGIGMAVPSAAGQPHFAVSVASTKERMTKDHIEFVRRMMVNEITNFSDVSKWPF